MIVVDANVIIYLIRETLFTPMAQELYIADNCWAVPYLVTEDKQIKNRCPDVARSLNTYLTSLGKITGIREKQATYNIKKGRKTK